MREKRMFISVMLITAMLFAGGCGRQTEPVNAKPTETVKKVDTEESMERPEATDNSEKEADAGMRSEAKPADQSSSDGGSGSGSSNGSSTEDTDNPQTTSADTAKPVEPVQPEQVTPSEPAQTTPAEPVQATPAAPAVSEPVQTTPAAPAVSEPIQTIPAETEKPVQTAPAPEPVPEPVPVHEHTWKEHTATKQTWIPNIVVVDDYETHIVEYYLFICYCDFETTDADTIAQHVKNHVYAGEIELSGFGIQDHSYTEQVKVGSHEEDQGHYETSTYVDYYYCDCGATQ